MENEVVRRLAVSSSGWLDLERRSALIVLIKTVARDGLSLASRAGFEIAAERVKSATRDSTIIAFRETQVVRSVAIGDSIVFLGIYDELRGAVAALLLAVPARFFCVPRHMI
jgi:hypothetical protein